jgi:Leucine-rich repeat (LRR) protein
VLYYLDLSENQLTSIPSSIGSLVELVYLYINNNQLVGGIPSSIGFMSLLEYLDLSENLLTGIPSSIGSLLMLVNLRLNDNQLVGSIPSSIGSLSKLEYLNLINNNLTGCIPSSIGSLSRLNVLSLENNQLTGSIPSSLGSLLALTDVYLNDNQLTGSIPSSIGSLSKLGDLILFDNYLTGSIPSTIGSLSQLGNLQIHANRLTGSIPSSIGSLFMLLTLYLFDNQLTDSIPSSIGSLSAIEDFILYNNQLTGSIPSSIGSLSTLGLLYLYNNQLSGSIPSSTTSVYVLAAFLLFSNHLTGTIPSGLFSSLSSLVAFDVSSNQLSGRILDQIQSLNGESLHLYKINIANNMFTGSFSSLDFTYLSALINLNAISNCFTGSISDTICLVSDTLQSFTLGGAGTNPSCGKNAAVNRRRPSFVHGYFSPLGLEGSIPSCIFGFDALSTLQLSGNKLDGTIAELSSNSTLTVLLLSNNALTGTIPLSIQRHAFESLDLSNNRLHGTLVDDFFVSSGQNILGLSVNRLSGPLPSSLKESSVPFRSNLSSLSILATNMFGCDNSELPKSDPSTESYSCGSFEMDIACYVFVSSAGATILVMMVLSWVFSRTKLGSSYFILMIQKFHNKWQMVKSWYQSFQEFRSLHTFRSSTMPSSVSSSRLVFPETVAFFVLSSLISKWTRLYLLFCLMLLIPIFGAFSLSGSSIITFTYGYTISSTFLHGLGPVLFVIIVLVLLFSIFVLFYRGLKSLFEWHFTRIHTDHKQTWGFGMKVYAVIISLHVVNLAVTVTVNAVYVSTLLSQSTVSQSLRLCIQILVGTFKLVWNGIYIPSAVKWLERYMSYSSSMRNYMVMSLINFIVAPCIATISSNQSCFYYVFVSQTSIQAPPAQYCLSYTYTETSNGWEYICEEYEFYSFESSSRPPFQYSYVCGSALLVAYIPVLLYSYTIAGLVNPCIRLLMIDHENAEEKKRNTFYTIIRSILVSDRVQGRQLITNYLIQIIVMLTFGLASPILSIVIGICILSNILLHQILVGRIWKIDKMMSSSASGLDERVKTATTSLKHEHPNAEINPVHVTYETADATSNTFPYQHSRLPVNMLILDNLDMKDAWNSVFVNGLILVITVSSFWACLFFDMISDGYGSTNGFITSCLFGFLVPLMTCVAYRNIPSSWEIVRKVERAVLVWVGMTVGPCEDMEKQSVGVVVERDVGLEMRNIVQDRCSS